MARRHALHHKHRERLGQLLDPHVLVHCPGLDRVVDHEVVDGGARDPQLLRDGISTVLKTVKNDSEFVWFPEVGKKNKKTPSSLLSSHHAHTGTDGHAGRLNPCGRDASAGV